MPEQESARQKKQGKTERTQRAGALNASPPAEELVAWDISSYLIGDMSFNPPFHRHAAILSEAPSDEVRATLARQLQQTYGNHYVQRLVQSMEVQATPLAPWMSAPIQRREEPKASKEVPDLPEKTVENLKRKIKEGQKEAALKELVESETVKIRAPAIKKCQVFYSDKLTPLGKSGLANPVWSKGKLISVTILIGDKPFETVSNLYSTLMHECEHAKQFFDDPSTAKGEESQGSLPEREFEAFLWEIDNLTATGLSKSEERMKYLGRMLHRYWILIPDDSPFSARKMKEPDYKRAIYSIRLRTGDFAWKPEL